MPLDDDISPGQPDEQVQSQAMEPIVSPTILLQTAQPITSPPTTLLQAAQVMPDWKIFVDSLTSEITTQVTAQLKDTFIAPRTRAPLVTLFNGVNANLSNSQQIVSDLKTEIVKAMASSCGLDITWYANLLLLYFLI